MQQLTPSQLEAMRAKTNKVLNYVDFAVMLFSILLFIILASSSNTIRDDPLMTFIFIIQIFNMYLMFRVKFAIELPFFWCSSCSERRHLKFHFCNGFFAVFTIFCDVLDLFRSMITKNGLFQSNKGLFVFEIISLLAAVAVIVIFCKFPKLILSRRALAREVDLD